MMRKAMSIIQSKLIFMPVPYNMKLIIYGVSFLSIVLQETALKAASRKCACFAVKNCPEQQKLYDELLKEK
jgi:hypothetical protein